MLRTWFAFYWLFMEMLGKKTQNPYPATNFYSSLFCQFFPNPSSKFPSRSSICIMLVYKSLKFYKLFYFLQLIGPSCNPERKTFYGERNESLKKLTDVSKITGLVAKALSFPSKPRALSICIPLCLPKGKSG